MKYVIALIGLFGSSVVLATEWHVAMTGTDADAGTRGKPFRTIQKAADAAQPGDVITVHAGVYRERINPPRGGTSDSRRIVYQAASGEKVEIKGSEPIRSWKKLQGDVWEVTLPNAFFGDFNPYGDLIRGDWFIAKKREHHTGAVYLDGEWLIEAATREEVMGPAGKTPLWFGHVDPERTTILAQFVGVDPNQGNVEINVRRTVFYPGKPGCNFLTVRGFTMRHAATPWAPPTAEQIGLIGTHWSKGWIIEGNTVSHSICSGIALGKHGDAFDNTSANSAEGYVKTIERAHAHAISWTKENIGHHLVRSNHVSHCEQAGIVGSLGCAFSTVSDNVIHDIHVRQLFGGAEMSAIKFHGAIDTEIRHNRIYRSSRGLWLDWMAQGTRVTRNLFYANSGEDVFVEVNHGPFLIDNNLLLSGMNLWDWSEGGAYVHNLFAGQIWSRPELKRETPYHPPHSTVVAGLVNIKGGDNRFYNNLFVGSGVAKATVAKVKEKADTGFGLWVYDRREYPLLTAGNIYLNGARPYVHEERPQRRDEGDVQVTVVEAGEEVYVQSNVLQSDRHAGAQEVTSARLGVTKVSKVPYRNPDDTAIRIDADYFGNMRHSGHLSSGPFENPVQELNKLRVW